uniref:PadR family transcriptional regulator n=1 Tax=Clostridium sp. NkU-1 TaxID=1095009 RepID=UPI000AEE63EC
MIPLYILGLLQRYGPQHGYQIKKIIAEQLSDFTQIKLPTIYYHLEKMETDGLLSANREKSGSRPEKNDLYDYG